MSTSTVKDILADLVAFPTVSTDQGAHHAALEYIEQFLEQRGMHIRRFEQGGYESLVATTRQTKSPRVLLAAHVDVVPAPPLAFKLEERDGKFYGRGVCDMKFAIASYLQLIDDIREDIRRYDLGIMITTDEEVGGRDGVKMLLDKAGYRSEACVLPDGGDNWALEREAKGLLWIIATTSGVSAHGSRPWEGASAIEKMMNFLRVAQYDLFAEQSDKTSTCNIGTIQGGNAVNQVADVCSANLDIRPINREEQAHIIDHLKKLSRQYDVGLEYRLNDSPINVDLSNPYVIAYVESVERVIGRPIEFVKSNGGSDARYFAGYDIPTLVGYPTGGGRHGDKEWLDVQGFYQFNDMLHDFVERTAKTTDQKPAKSLTSAQ
jgi:acetylornithine deacetylase/succinyl-diaminopimelate desuccinylase-like protein